MEHLKQNYQDNRIFNLDDNEVKMGLKDVALISRMKVADTKFNPTETSHPMFREYFLELKKLHTRKSINPFLVVDSLRRLNQGIRV